MKLPLRLPVLPSQCFSPVTDYDLDGRHGSSASRQPLEEATGNAQHNHLRAMVRSSSYDQRAESVYSIPPSMPTPPFFPGQSLDFNYGVSQYSRLQQQQHAQSGRMGLGRNPFWLSPQFQAYRKRQAERDDKSGQKWPEMLEEAFLDAFLLIPQIRKMKYSLKGKLYGRNMLIGEYVWLYYVASLPPGVQPDEKQMRTRKQVSSHIQVLKNFLKEHPFFHIFFPIYLSKREGDGEGCEKESFKNHPVLIALTEQRLPDERPNYEYFSHILSLKDQVSIKPKRCWIFVSHRDVVVQEDGSGRLTATGDRLHRSEYPHLKLNLEREKWAKEEQQIFKGALLHEFTKDLSQFESSTIREISEEWEDTCPELHQKLEDIIATDPRCDILHMQSTLELKEKRRFPGHSDLNSWVEINIEQPHLLNHRWKVETTLVRPAELSYTNEKSAPETVYKTSAKISIQYQHRPGCEGHRNAGEGACDGVSRCRRDCVIVPFPADVWALTLTNCAEYPAHPSIESIRRGNRRTPPVKREDGDDDEDSKGGGEQLTQMSLVPRIAMLQELWSCPPEDPNDFRDDSQTGDNKRTSRWERRGLILWTFQTVHSIEENTKTKQIELKTAPNGKTQWRFLSILDTSSQYHQQQVMVRGPAPVGKYREGHEASRNGSFASSGKLESGASSPATTYSHHQQLQHRARISRIMSESFPSGWDLHSGGLNSSLSSSAAQAQPAYNAHLMVHTGHTGGILDSLGGGSGLATPPPSASLASSFATSFESVINDAGPLAGYMATHVTAADMGAHSQTLGDLSAVTDPFLASATTSAFDGATYDEGSHEDVSGWDSGSTVQGVGVANNWSTGYSTTTGNHPGAVLTWAQSSPTADSSVTNTSNELRHYSQHHHNHHHPPGHPQQPHHWVTGTVPEEAGFWTPATSADDAVQAALDGRDQVLWQGTAQPNLPTQVEDDHPHPPHSENGEDWVQVQSSCDVATSFSAAATTASVEDDGVSSELSQGWEEIVAASTASETQYHHGQGTDQDDILGNFPISPLNSHHAGNGYTPTQGQYLEHRGQKRGRSDSNRRMELERQVVARITK